MGLLVIVRRAHLHFTPQKRCDGQWGGGGASLLEHQRNEILKEARVEPNAMVIRRRWLEWFGHIKRRHETENIRAIIAEMRWRGSALEEDRKSGRNGRLTEKGKVRNKREGEKVG